MAIQAQTLMHRLGAQKMGYCTSNWRVCPSVMRQPGTGCRERELLHCLQQGGSMNQKLVDDINEKLKAVMAQSPAADLERNLRAMLGAAFARLDLVSREEFDIQREVLARSRARLAELEKQVAALEAAASTPERR